MASSPIRVRQKLGACHDNHWKVQCRVYLPDGTVERPSPTFHERWQAELFKKRAEYHRPQIKGDVMPSEQELVNLGLITEDSVRQTRSRQAAPPPEDESEPESTFVTVGQAVELYLHQRERNLQDRPTDRTLKGYWSLYRNSIAGTPLADCNVATVTGAEVQDWFNAEKVRDRKGVRRGKGLTNVSCNSARAILAQMFKWSLTAKSGGGQPLRTTMSPMVEVKQFRKSRNKTKPILSEAEEFETFVRCAYKVDPWWADMIVIAMLTGMRFGEISALTVGQIDWTTCGWVIDRRFSEGREEPGTKGSRFQVLGETIEEMLENDEGILSRQARVPKSVWAIIEDRCKGKPTKARVFDGPEFCGIRGNERRWIASSNRRNWVRLDELLAEHGIAKKIRTHGLRHTFTTYLRSNNIEESVRRGILGHADEDVHDRYLQLTEKNWERVIAVLEPLAEPVMEIRTRAYLEYMGSGERAGAAYRQYVANRAERLKASSPA